MIHGKKVIVVMPAYNAEKTLKQTYSEIPGDIVDEVILTDDCSRDATVEKARELGIAIIGEEEFMTIITGDGISLSSANNTADAADTPSPNIDTIEPTLF